MTRDVTSLCWARCTRCALDFHLGCVVPCALAVYVAALKAARCPRCCERTSLQAYSPGLQPEDVRDKSFTIRFGTS